MLYYRKFPISQKAVLDSTALRLLKHMMRLFIAILRVIHSKDKILQWQKQKVTVNLQTLFNIWLWNKILDMSNIKTRNFRIRPSWLVLQNESALIIPAKQTVLEDNIDQRNNTRKASLPFFSCYHPLRAKLCFINQKELSRGWHALQEALCRRRPPHLWFYFP